MQTTLGRCYGTSQWITERRTNRHLDSPDCLTAVASLGEGRDGPPRVTPSRGDTRPNFLWLNLERTLDKTTWEDGRLVRRRRLKRSSLSEAMTKNVVRKNRVTQKTDTHIVAAPGDINPSNATAWPQWQGYELRF